MEPYAGLDLTTPEITISGNQELDRLNRLRHPGTSKEVFKIKLHVTVLMSTFYFI